MKITDIEKIRAAGLITAGQRDQIIAHFQLKDEGGRFLAIISLVGAVLMAAGIALLIASHWGDIPRGVKLFCGLALMLGAHGGGWWLRERSRHPKTGEALHFAGSLLFLANIALVGQIYHLSSRPGNAFLLWWLGLAALPWLLSSPAQLVLLLTAIGIWLGVQINDSTSVIRCGDERQILFYALLGLVYTGLGFCLRRNRDPRFARVAEGFGLVVFFIFSYPLTWACFGGWQRETGKDGLGFMALLALLAAAGTMFGSRHLTALTRFWRVAWGAALAGAAALLAGASWLPPERDWHWLGDMSPLNTAAAAILFAYALLQMQIGVQQRSRFLVNLGVVFIAFYIMAVYLGLIGSMAFTGLMFVISGVLLLAFGIFLEKKRRSLLKTMKTNLEVQP